MKSFERIPALEIVKREIREWTSKLGKYNTLIFVGNPASGKSIFGKNMGDICKEAGIVSKGHVIETHYNMLVDFNAKDAKTKSREVFEGAIGGVLYFSDGLKTLLSILYRKDINNINYCKDIFDVLLDVINNNKDLVVILEGDYNDFDEFSKSDSYFKNIFDTVIEFNDYTAIELVDIFKAYCDKSKINLDFEAEQKLLNIFKKYLEKAKRYHNGMIARVFFETILEQKILKVYRDKSMSFSDKCIIKVDDLIEDIE